MRRSFDDEARRPIHRASVYERTEEIRITEPSFPDYKLPLDFISVKTEHPAGCERMLSCCGLILLLLLAYILICTDVLCERPSKPYRHKNGLTVLVTLQPVMNIA